MITYSVFYKKCRVTKNFVIKKFSAFFKAVTKPIILGVTRFKTFANTVEMEVVTCLVSIWWRSFRIDEPLEMLSGPIGCYSPVSPLKSILS